MKTMFLSAPVLAVVRKVVPAKKRPSFASLLLLRILPGWAIAAWLVSFLWSARKKSLARRAYTQADAQDLR